MNDTTTNPKLTEHERREIDRANESGLQPVVFVHGLWLLGNSWDRWRALFEEQGYTTLAPGWPDDPETVEEANLDPEVFARKKIKQITDHFVEVFRVVPFLAEQIENEPRIEVAAAGSHHEATRRCESHGRIHRLPVAHGGQAGAVAEMRDYDAAPRLRAQSAHNVFV